MTLFGEIHVRDKHDALTLTPELRDAALCAGDGAQRGFL